jgi:ankyrin repeat protein
MLHYAVDRGHEAIVKYLLSIPSTNMNILDKYHQTPLHYGMLMIHA